MGKRARPSDFKSGSSSASAKKKARSGRTNRQGFSSVARSRGAAVTGEMKYIDTNETFTIPASADWTATEADNDTTLCVHGVPQVGAGVNQRIGKSIKIKKLKIRGFIFVPPQVNQAAADNPANIRLILAQDMQTNSAQAQGETLMTSAGSSGLSSIAFQNIDSFGRFKVLADKTITMNNPTVTYDGTNVEQTGMSKPFKMNFNFKTPVVTRFNATNGGTVADIVDNSFHLYATTSNAELAPQILWSSRLCYKE